jgi:hypothetical protein
VAAAVVLTVLAGLTAAWLWWKASQSWLVQVLWRWFTGMDLDGQPRPRRWRRRHHAAVRTGGTVAMFGLLYGLLAARTVTLAAVAAVVLAGIGVGGWLLWRRRLRHLPVRWRYARPLARRLAPMLEGAPPQLQIEPDRTTKVWLPPGFVGTTREWEQIDNIVSTTLALEAPIRDPQMEGRSRYVRYTPSEPPPGFLTWEDVADLVAAAELDEVILGLGKKRVKVSGSLSGDSPHVGYNMGSGGGKTNLGSFNSLQFLHRGDIGVIIDAKLISYPWARGLPNVCYAGTIAEIHDVLVGLGTELQNRNEESLAGLQPSGAIDADVGPRILIFAEELNFVVPKLKRYWADLRALDKSLPKRSPALDAIADIAFAGRQVMMHVFFIGQMLTAAATGASDSSVRGNIGIACMARYVPSSWSKMSPLPMPPVPTTPGRIQVVTAAGIRETQVPYLSLDVNDRGLAGAAAQWAREYAVSGRLSHLPHWMPGAKVLRVPQPVLALQGGSDQGIDVRQPALSPPRPANAVTLAEMVTANLFPTLAAARKAAQRGNCGDAVGEERQAKLYDVTTVHAWRKADR